MSNTANWSYTNIAKVKPFVSMDQFSGAVIYGTEYEIACTWTAESKQMIDAQGREFVSTNIIYTEDDRPKFMDLIKLSTDTEYKQIQAVTGWDMSFFGETPDFKLVT